MLNIMITTDDYNDDTASKNIKCNKTNHSSLGKEPNSKINITTVAMMELHIYIYIYMYIYIYNNDNNSSRTWHGRFGEGC